MLITETTFPGLLMIELAKYADNRGYFFEAYNEEVFHAKGIKHRFVQDNQSNSLYGVIRGLHYQMEPYAQVKLVRVLQGTILDVAVDIRVGSPTYGKYYSIELSAENKKQLLIPAGFAHGFSVLTGEAEVLYKCNTFYNKNSEGGIVYNDEDLQIDWKIPVAKQVVSEKDKNNPRFSSCKNNFNFQ